MANVFRGKKFGVRLAVVLLITLLVVLIQIISVSRIGTPAPYPWEEQQQQLSERKTGRDINGRDLRTVQTPIKHEVKPDIVTHESHHQQLTKEPKVYHKNNSESTIPPSSKGTPVTASPSNPSSPLTPVSPINFCYITSKDALSALERAKTEECRNTIRNVTCRAQSGKLYDTGIRNMCPLGRNPTRQFQHIPYENGVGPLPRVVFLLSIHGRAVRQIQRLFKAIYHSDHFYYIHVDARSDFLYREVMKMFADYPNVYVPKWQMTTIWGGSSLLKMLLRSLHDLEYVLSHWKWDFFINLSESDYPLKTNDELVQFLRVHRNTNFVKTHGGDINKFIQKQGLDRTFVECENHMWRIANRQLPDDITVDGGSDWIAINRNYSHYLVTKRSRYLNGLKRYYEYSLLPAESFFHTVLRNGPLCHTLVRSNLRITNWNRKLGCRCQYRHIVDWCGCSPNDFLPKDMNKLKNPGAQNFFGRKFEAIVNQQVINELHAHLYGTYPEDTPSLSSYWQNSYHSDDTLSHPSSAQYTAYQSFMRHGLKLIRKSRNESACPSLPANSSVKEVHVYHRSDSFVGFVVKFQESGDRSDSSPVFELLVTPKSVFEIQDQSEELSKRITSIEIGSDWDGKESIFRNYGGLLGVYDNPVLALRLKIGKTGDVLIVWENPLGAIVDRNTMKLDPSWTVNFHKPKLDKPLMPGVWRVWLEINSKIYILQDFLVTPIVYDRDVPLHDPVAVNGRHLVQQEKGTNLDQRYEKWAHNVVKTGPSLLEWIDELTSKFWSVQFVCSTAPCKGISPCDESTWSSMYPDTKSELGPVQPNGRIS